MEQLPCVLLVLLLLQGVTQGQRLSCGGAAGPCSCGDAVINSHVLSMEDPIVQQPCSARQGTEALLLAADGINLDCDGYTLQSLEGIDRVVIGVLIPNPIQGTSVRNCVIRNFIDGIATGGDFNPMSLTVVNCTILDSVAFGIYAQGARITLMYNVILRTAGTGIFLSEGLTGHYLYRNQVTDAAHCGIVVTGEHNVLKFNKVSCVGLFGIQVIGNFNKMSFSEVSLAGYDGIRLIGSYNIMYWNIVLTLVAVGSPAITVRGDYNKIVWSESTAFGDNQLVIEGVQNEKSRRVVPPPLYDLLYEEDHPDICPTGDIIRDHDSAYDRLLQQTFVERKARLFTSPDDGVPFGDAEPGFGFDLDVSDSPALNRVVSGSDAPEFMNTRAAQLGTQGGAGAGADTPVEGYQPELHRKGVRRGTGSSFRARSKSSSLGKKKSG